MRNSTRLVVMAGGLAALAAFGYGCQVRDGLFPTEADRTLQTSVEASEVIAKINEVITDPTLGKSARSQFQTIVKLYPKKPNDARAKARTLIDFILKHFQEGKWEGADGTGELVALILAYVDLAPEAQGATTCIPGSPCQGEATGNNEFAGAKIPGDLVDIPFVLLFTPNADLEVKPPLFGLVYDISTYPAGITFPNSSASGSLTLSSEDDQPVAGVCSLDADDPKGIPAGVHPDSLYVVHLENGVWERLPQVDITFLDCSTASSELPSTSLWSNPVLEPILDFLSPDRAVAGGIKSGGAITSFSPHATEVGGPLPTTTTVEIVGGQTSYTVGENITLRATVWPEPAAEGNPEVIFVVQPVKPGAPVVPLVEGTAQFTFVCGSDRVPEGSHTAGAAFLGTPGFEPSQSGQVLSFDCNPAGD